MNPEVAGESAASAWSLPAGGDWWAFPFRFQILPGPTPGAEDTQLVWIEALISSMTVHSCGNNDYFYQILKESVSSDTAEAPVKSFSIRKVKYLSLEVLW